MKRILIPVAITIFLCSTAIAGQGGGGESTKPKPSPKKTSGTKSSTTPPGPTVPPARPKSPTVANLMVKSNLPNATVTINGRTVGTTDSSGYLLLGSLKPGNYNVIIIKPGYQHDQKFVNLSAGQSETLDFELKPITQSINVSSTPAECEIYIDDVLRGRTDSSGNARVAGIPLGEHRITIRKSGFREASFPLSFSSEKEERITAKLELAGTRTNQSGIEFVLIPPGSFMMGSTNGPSSEKPVRQVTISYSFFMGKYEVTQTQWQAVMGNNPSHFKACGGNCPVEQVSWNDAQEFIRKLNQMNDGYTYRLPSEAEWEYACRAGTTGDYAGDLDSMAWYGNNSGERYIEAADVAADVVRTRINNYDQRLMDNGNRTHAVGTKAPNRFGLYDMHGNVGEWCEDPFHMSYDRAPNDGSAWLSSSDESLRVVRSYSFMNFARALRSAYRYRQDPDKRTYVLGFRVVAVVRTQ